MNNIYHIIGIMSGTSLDGIDIVKCIFIKDKEWTFKIEYAETIPYTGYWRKKLKSLHLHNELDIKEANIEFGRLLGESTKDFIEKYNIKCDYISSHGHTIFHEPENKYNLQIGDGRIISEINNITTINNYRSLDISLGGQGAPLVPIGDLLLFSSYQYCLNLGGFANLSQKKKNNCIIAFDICPVNFILNKLSNTFNLTHDNNGDIASSGKINIQLLNELNQIKYYTKNPPKSLSREWTEKNINPILDSSTCPNKDKMSTFCEHIAIQIGKYLENESVLITGGGTFNKYLISRIENYSSSKIIIPDNNIINFKEAIIFAFLGVLKIRNENNSLSSVTGATRDSSSGDMFIK